MANKHQNILYPASAVCFCMLLLGIIFPYSHTPDTADAVAPDPATYNLTLDLNNSVDINIDPSIAGKLQVETQSIGVKANSPNGYQLLFAVDGNDNNIYLDGKKPTGTADPTKTIFAASAANSNLALDNTHFARWGYSTSSDTNFSPLPTAGNEVQLKSETSSTGSAFRYTTVKYGIKANLGLSSGAYTTKINYIAISNLANELHVAAITGTKEFSPTDVASGAATTIVATGLSMTGKALTPSDLTVQIGTTTVPTANITIEQQLPNLKLNVKLPTNLAVGNYAVTVTLNDSHVASNFKSYTIAAADGISVANPVTTFDKAFAAAGKSKRSGYYTMQDMSTSICNAVTTGTSNDGSDTQVAQLIDTRDNKVYWVAKLKTAANGSTGECWMTQNLDYNISASTNVVSNTDGTTSTWTSSATYKPTATATTASSNSTNTATYSWDLGNYYWHPQDNTSWTSCGTSAKTYADCSATGKGFKTTVPTKDIANKDIDGAHYQVGTLYQWNAATAGTGGTNTSKDATSSICPANWRLPTSNSTTADRSFGKMLTAYGYSSWSDKKTISQAPLFFVPAGYVASGTLRYAGSVGYYWSSMAYSNTSRAYYLYFTSSSVNPSDTYNRCLGNSVRCVAR